ncbi:MAG: ribonuclease J [Bacilli bacterium]|nr:ribonuclease J [Bacilli bacterium]
MNNFSSHDGVSIYALGGLGEVGKNTYCLETEQSIVLIDAGVKFPEANLPGVDYVIPDYTHLKLNKHKIKALIITHGHEDHIGGIPFLIQMVHIPTVYAPKLAAELIRHKLDMMRVREPINIVEYNANSHLKINGDEFKINFFRVTHSIPDAYGIVIDTKEGRIATTGDFKVDLTPVGEQMELNKIAHFGEQGVDLLLSDSTNAEIEGYTPSEKNVFQSLNDVFRKAPGRIIVSTFSSNISRIQQVAIAAYRHHRKIAIVGRSMEFAIQVSRKYGYIKIPDDAIINSENVNNFKTHEICIICTGSQGEVNAALSKIAAGEHKSIHVVPGDTIVFSSSPIPGNGEAIDRLINTLSKRGANVLTNGMFSLHSSGHPSRQELRLMLKLFQPKYFMPDHGEYRMLKLHAMIAESLGIPKENIFINDNGNSLVLRNHIVTRGKNVPVDDIYLDGYNINGISSNIIRERKMLKEEGLIAITATIDNRDHKLLKRPRVYYKGFVINNEDKFRTVVENAVYDELIHSLRLSNEEIKAKMLSTALNAIRQVTERNPLIVPILLTSN